MSMRGMVAYFFVVFCEGGGGGLFRSTPPTAPWNLESLGPVSGDAGLVVNLCPGGTGPGFSPKGARAFGAYLLLSYYGSSPSVDEVRRALLVLVQRTSWKFASAANAAGARGGLHGNTSPLARSRALGTEVVQHETLLH